MGFSASSIFSFFWTLVSGFVYFIVGQVESVLSSLFSGLSFSFIDVFQSFGVASSKYGVWGPVMLVVGIGTSIMVGYLFMVFIGAEKDVTGVEDDL